MDRVRVVSASAMLFLVLVIMTVGASAKPQYMMMGGNSTGDDWGFGPQNGSMELPIQVVRGSNLPLPPGDIRVEPDFPEQPAVSPGRGWNDDARNDPARNEEYEIEGDPSSGTLVTEYVIEDEGPGQVKVSTSKSVGYGGPGRRYWGMNGTEFDPYHRRDYYHTTPWYRFYNWTTDRSWTRPYPAMTITTPPPSPWEPRASSTPWYEVIKSNEPEPECRCVCRRGARRRKVTTSRPEYEDVGADAVWERMQPGHDEVMAIAGKKKIEDETDNAKTILIVAIVVPIVVILIIVVICVLIFIWCRKTQTKKSGAVHAADGTSPVQRKNSRGAGEVPDPVVTVPIEVEGTSAGSS